VIFAVFVELAAVVAGVTVILTVCTWEVVFVEGLDSTELRKIISLSERNMIATGPTNPLESAVVFGASWIPS
jgi:hypothetical protein